MVHRHGIIGEVNRIREKPCLKKLILNITTSCANCCKTLGPDFKEADITRIAKYFKMKLPAFEAEFLQVDEDGDKVFKSMPCPFLGGDNLCSIYEVRPKACREFPHTDRKKIHQINHLTIKNTLTCPAAYLFVEKLKDKL